MAPEFRGATIRIPGLSSWLPFALGLLILVPVAVLTARQVLLIERQTAQNGRAQVQLDLLESAVRIRTAEIATTDALYRSG